MKTYFLPGLLSVLFLARCSDDKQEKTPPPVAKAEKKNYFPVLDYLRSEIGYVDSLPLGIVKYHIDHNKRDSGYIKTAEFDSLAREFLFPELDSANFENEYTESSFLDQTSQSLTFTYSTKNEKNPLKRIDVLASPELGFDKVKSIYMEKTISGQDTSTIKKMYWRAKHNFQIITISQVTNQPPITRQLKVVWDNHD